MAEITTPNALGLAAGKPVMHSAVEEVKKAVEAQNASQKADLMFEGAQATKKMFDRLGALERTVAALRERIETLEAEDGVVLPWSSDGLGPAAK